MWSVQMLIDRTSGEFGSGTGRGFVVGVKMRWDAWSSGRVEVVPLRAMEGAVLVTVCVMPAEVSSDIEDWSMAQGDMVRDTNQLIHCNGKSVTSTVVDEIMYT